MSRQVPYLLRHLVLLRDYINILFLKINGHYFIKLSSQSEVSERHVSTGCGHSSKLQSNWLEDEHQNSMEAQFHVVRWCCDMFRLLCRQRTEQICPQHGLFFLVTKIAQLDQESTHWIGVRQDCTEKDSMHGLFSNGPAKLRVDPARRLADL